MRLCAAVAAILVLAPDAWADHRDEVRAEARVKPPPAPASVTLRQGTVAGSLALELSVSSGGVLKPASVAPDLAVGVIDDLTIGVIHSGSALTGFRGSAGWGFCVTGTEANCRTKYTAGGVEGLYSIARGTGALALNAGVIWSSFEPTVHTDLKLGFKLKMSEGNVFAWFSPNVWVALDDRHDRVVPHEHQLFVPISLWVKPVPPVAFGIGTGVKGPLRSFADRMSIPIGVLAQYTFDPRFSVGASLVFGKILGGTDVMDPGVDARVVQLWLNIASR